MDHDHSTTPYHDIHRCTTLTTYSSEPDDACGYDSKPSSFSSFSLSFYPYIMHFLCHSENYFGFFLSACGIRVYSILIMRRHSLRCSILLRCDAFCTAFCYTTMGGAISLECPSERKYLVLLHLRRAGPARLAVSLYAARVYVTPTVPRPRPLPQPRSLAYRSPHR